MKVIVEENVLLESKVMIEDYAKDVENYGSNAMVFTIGEKGQCFRKRIVEYVLTFKTANGAREFRVGKNVFDRSREGTRGRLSYSKDRFVEFCTDNK